MRPALARFEAVALRGRQVRWACMPGELVARFRPRTVRIADAFAACLPGSEALRLNSATGLGHRGRASEAALDALVEFYREARCRAWSIDVAPGPQAERIAGWLRARGFVERGGFAMHARDLRGSVPSPRVPWRVRRARRGQLDDVIELFGRAFPVAPALREWSRAGAAAQGEHFLAYPVTRGRVAARAAAVATLIVDGRVGWLRGAATATPWRRRGAQGVLIAARLRAAARAGCRWAWCETHAPRPGRPDGSRRNLLRHGFVEVGRKAMFEFHGR